MKKFFCLLFIIGLFIIVGCGKSSKEIAVNYVDYKDSELSGNYTFRFVGQSEHFYFETGNVYFGDNIKELLLTNFKVKDNVSNDSKYLVEVYFNNKLLMGDDGSGELYNKEQFENINIAEKGKEPERDQNGNIIGEGDSFLETTKDNFKESIKVFGKYCINDKCEKEEFNIKYIDE